MKLSPRLGAFLFVALLAVGPLRADGPYLRHFDWLGLLPPPPAENSPEDLADRATTLRVYQARTPADVARGKAEIKTNVYTFADVIGPSLKPGQYPKLDALFDDVNKETRHVVDEAKNHWGRKRPYLESPADFPDIVDPDKAASYPSGHSTRATVFSLLLAEIFPDKRDALLAEGRLIGWTRIEIGVHNPLDIYAGRVLGQALVKSFLKNPDFQQDLAAVKAEVAAAR